MQQRYVTLIKKSSKKKKKKNKLWMLLTIIYYTYFSKSALWGTFVHRFERTVSKVYFQQGNKIFSTLELIINKQIQLVFLGLTTAFSINNIYHACPSAW